MGCGGTKLAREQQAREGVVTKDALEPFTTVPGKDAAVVCAFGDQENRSNTVGSVEDLRPVTASTTGGDLENLEEVGDEKASSAPSDEGPAPLPCLEEEPDEVVPGSIQSPRKKHGAPAPLVPKPQQLTPSPPPESPPPDSPPMKKVSQDLVKGVLDFGIKEVKEGKALDGSAGRREKDVEIIDISDEDAALDVFVPQSVDLASIDQNSESIGGM